MVAWINAELEQPKDDSTVLILKRYEENKLEVDLGFFSKQIQSHNNGWVCSCRTYPVAYWTPIPKLPEEQQ